jgi:hypothetical protein
MIMLGATGCASAGASNPPAPGTPEPATAVVVPPSQNTTWPVKTRENVDLWLHGFALLQTDTTLVPYFQRGYQEDMTVRKNSANVLTQLDVNREKLQRQLATNPALINAQFVPFYFGSVDEMHAAIDHFVAANGNPQSARSREEAAQFAVLASYFPSATERSWLALFASGLWDEDTKFYHSYWIQQQRERANVIDSVQALWQNLMRPRLQRVLNATQQKDGDLILSLPLDGEGRTVSGGGIARNAMGVTFPSRPSDAMDAMYVVAHEIVASIASTAIADNTTPAQQRSGEAGRYVSAAAVRGGLMLLDKLVPELADGYARYYVRATGKTAGADARTQLVSLFPLPDAIRDAIARQIELEQGGI